MSISIRFAELEDVRSIKTLVENMTDESTDTVEKLDRSATIERAVKNREILVATVRGEIVGFLHGVMHEDLIDGAPNCFISSFYVLPRHRNKGVGSKLLSSAIGHATENGATEIEASTMSERTKRLFERFGFAQHDGEVFLELRLP